MMDPCYSSGFVVIADGETVYTLNEDEDRKVQEWLDSQVSASFTTAALQSEVCEGYG